MNSAPSEARIAEISDEIDRVLSQSDSHSTGSEFPVGGFFGGIQGLKHDEPEAVRCSRMSRSFLQECVHASMIKGHTHVISVS